MQRAFFLISATTGCVNDLKSALRKNSRVRWVEGVISGEYDVIVLVASDEIGEPNEELGQLIDFQDSVGNLSKVYYDEESEDDITRKLVHRVSFNLLFPDSNPDFAKLDNSPGSYPPRGEAIQRGTR